MMTSVTLPSTSGPIHRGFSSVAEETTSSEPDFEQSRSIKRCLTTSHADSCKKRRKQSTPIRISAAESEPVIPEGKPSATTPEPDLQCPVCQLYFDNADQLQSHIVSVHSTFECKKEPFEEQLHQQQSFYERSGTPHEFTFPRPDMHLMNEIQSKEWMTRLPFNPNNTVFMPLPQFSQSENLQRQPIRIFNPDAYCDLCNKEFCNKYFLKTHKANKHGIYTDPPICESMPNSVTIPSYAANVKLTTSVPSVEIPPVKSELRTSAIVNPFSDIFPNPFSHKLLSKLHQTNQGNSNENDSNDKATSINGFSSNGESDKTLTDDPLNDESSSPRTIQNESTSYKSDQDALYYVPTSKLSPGQISLSREFDLSNRLRKIGVMNPKAFCEICCKEYCNKYFLRTHKLKRHGIYIPDDKDMKMEGIGCSPWPQSMQTSPLNLIMTEQSTLDRKTTSPADIGCDTCGIKFQNASLSQLHNVSVHSKLYSKESESTEQISDESKKMTDISNTGEKSLNAEAISEDLQKLQTMILQLNDLGVSKIPITCSACNKEFENRYFLHAHMLSEHGIILDDVTDMEKPGESDNSSNNNTMCDLCGKDIQNVDELKKHMLDFHPNHQLGGESIKDEYNLMTTPEKGINRVSLSAAQIAERRISISLTPTSSYCDICNKELCNKYFMKTHMQRMHGIEIENGAQIGGVICDICNKELCSKYFLRVHKHNTHGIVEYGASLLQPRKSEGDTTPTLSLEPDPALKPVDLADLSHRYFTHFTEVCTICSRRFRSTKWLKAHLLSDHGQAGAEKWAELEQKFSQTIGQHSKIIAQTKLEQTSPTLKIPNGNQDNQPKVGIQNVLSNLFGVDEPNPKTYQCSVCPFTTTLLPLLFVHERSHSLTAELENNPIKCPVCNQTFLKTELLQHHMFSQHPFLPLPPFFNGCNENQTESKETSESTDEEGKAEEANTSNGSVKGTTPKKNKYKTRKELSPEMGQCMKDVAKKTQMPTTYALPQGPAGEELPPSSYFMQAFLLEEVASERRVVPAVVFLPVLQKQPTPISMTFTLTPA